MNYWGKVTNTLGNIAGNTQEAVTAELKKKDKEISALKQKIQKLEEDTEYINKAYEELEQSTKDKSQQYEDAGRLTSNCVKQIISATKSMEDTICEHFLNSLHQQLQQKLGEEEENIPNEFKLSIISADFLREKLEPIFEKYMREVEKSKSIEEEYKANKKLLEEKTSQFESILREKKEESSIVIQELKNMLATEKDQFYKLNTEYKQMKISQDKYQKQIYDHCQDKNNLTLRNKQLEAKLSEIEASLEQEKQKNSTSVIDRTLLMKTAEQLNKVTEEVRQVKQLSVTLIEQISNMNPLNPEYEEKILSKISNTFERISSSSLQAKQNQNNLTSVIQILKEQNDKFAQLIQQNNSDCQKLSGQLQAYSMKNQKLVQQNQEKAAQIINLKHRERNLEQQLAQISMLLQEKSSALNEALSHGKTDAEVEQLKEELTHALNQKALENENLKSELQILENKLNYLNSELQKKQNQIEAIKIQYSEKKEPAKQQQVAVEGKLVIQTEAQKNEEMVADFKEETNTEEKAREGLEPYASQALLKDLEKVKMENLQLKEQLVEKQQGISDLKNQIDCLKSCSEESKGLVNNLQEQVKTLNESIKLNQNQKSSLTNKLKQYQSKQQISSDIMEKLRARNQQLEQQLEESLKQMSRLSAEVENKFASASQQSESLRKQLEQALQKLENQSSKYSQLESQHQRALKLIDLNIGAARQNEKLVSSKASQLQTLQSLLKNKQDQFKKMSQKMENEIKRAQDDLNRYKEIIQKLQANSQQLEQKNTVIQQQLEQANQQKNNYKSIEETFNKLFSATLSKQKVQQIAKQIKNLKSQETMRDHLIKQSLQKLKQKTESLEKLERDLNAANQKLESAVKQNQKLKKQKQQANSIRESSSMELQNKIANLNKEISSLHEKQETSKKESQTMKNKYAKMQKSVSELAMGNKELTDKTKRLQDNMTEYKTKQKTWESQKASLLQKLKSKEQEMGNLHSQMQKVVIQSAERVKKQRSHMSREISDREEVFKVEKIEIERKFLTEIDKLKASIKEKQKKISQKEQEIVKANDKWKQQKKIIAQLNARLQDLKANENKMQNIEEEKLQLKKKLFAKEQQLRKVYSNINNYKSTISELEEGIQTYQSYAEEKNQQILQIQQQYAAVKERLNQVLKEKTNIQHQFQQQVQILSNGPTVKKMMSEEEKRNEEVLGRKQIIVPIKRLFLKYFESTSTYDQKLQTLTTLCEVLGLDSKQKQIMKNYKKSKLSYLADNTVREKPEQRIQNKFFDFLTSDG